MVETDQGWCVSIFFIHQHTTQHYTILDGGKQYLCIKKVVSCQFNKEKDTVTRPPNFELCSWNIVPDFTPALHYRSGLKAQACEESIKGRYCKMKVQIWEEYYSKGIQFKLENTQPSKLIYFLWYYFTSLCFNARWRL